MFENEAEERGVEYADKQKRTISIHEDSGYSWGQIEEAYENGFKDGAELGYKKANEWHFIKDGKLPKDESRVWLYFGNDDYNDGQFICNGFWCGSSGWFDVDEVIAWQELVPPESLKNAEEKK